MQKKSLHPYFLLALLLGTFVLTFQILNFFLAPLVLAAIFAVVLQPVFIYIKKLSGNRPSLASFATIVLFLIVVIIPLSFLARQLFIEAQEFYTNISQEVPKTAAESGTTSFIQKITNSFPAISGIIGQLQANVDQYVRQLLTWVIQHLGTAFSSLLALFLEIFIFFVTLYYLLKDGKKFTNQFVELSPLSDKDDVRITDRFDDAINSVVRGQLSIAFIQGIFAGIGFFIFGLQNFVLLGMTTAIAALVPTIGTALIFAPVLFYLVTTGSISQAVGLAIWAICWVGIIDNLLGPKLIGKGLHLHPLLVMLAVFGGIAFFGPIGIFLGPITISLLMVLLDLYRDLLHGANRIK